MRYGSWIDNERANSVAFQQLKPRERLLWAGYQRLPGLGSTAVLFLVPVVVVFAWHVLVRGPHLSLIGVIPYLGAFAALVFAAIKARKNLIVALTDRRIMVINPGRTAYWFRTKDMETVDAQIYSDGSGDIKIRFRKPVQPETKTLSSTTQSDSALGTMRNIVLSEYSFSGVSDAQGLRKLLFNTITSQGESLPTPFLGSS